MPEEPICIKRLALVAAGIVKSPLGQCPANLFTVMTVSGKMRISGQIGLEDGEVLENSADGIPEDPALETGRCMRQPALNAAKDVKSLSSLRVKNPFTAMIVSEPAKVRVQDQKNLIGLKSSLSN